MKRIIVGISGVRGAIYGVRILEMCQNLPEFETHIIVTESARKTIEAEANRSAAEIEALADHVHSNQDLVDGIAADSPKTAGVIVAPCSSQFLSGIVDTTADNLLIRAAKATLKGCRHLILMPCETVLHSEYCRLLFEASKLGAVITPPVAALYNNPGTFDDIVNQAVGRALDHFEVDMGFIESWGKPMKAII